MTGMKERRAVIFGGAIAAVATLVAAAVMVVPGATDVPALSLLGLPLVVPVLLTWKFILGDSATAVTMASVATPIGLAINIPIGCFLGLAYRVLHRLLMGRR
jgi:hypothetical protein